MSNVIVVDSDSQVVAVHPDQTNVVVGVESPSIGVSVERPGVQIVVDHPSVDVTSDDAVVEVSSKMVNVVVQTTGPRGAQGGGGRQETHRFDIPSTVWVVEPDFLANIVVLNSAGEVVEPGEITYRGNEITLMFSAPFSGLVHCFD